MTATCIWVFDGRGTEEAALESASGVAGSSMRGRGSVRRLGGLKRRQYSLHMFYACGAQYQSL